MDRELKQIVSRIEKLEKAVFGQCKLKKSEDKKGKSSSIDIDCSLNERAFVKRYAADKSGPKKFVLLLAYHVKGEIDKNIELSVIRKSWNKMSSKQLLGKFNMYYPNESKTRGWVNSKEYGSYSLTKEWKSVLKMK